MEAGGGVSVDVALGSDDCVSVGLAEGEIVSLLEGVTEGVRVEGMAVSWRAGSPEAVSVAVLEEVADDSFGVGVRLVQRHSGISLYLQIWSDTLIS